MLVQLCCWMAVPIRPVERRRLDGLDELLDGLHEPVDGFFFFVFYLIN